MPSSFFNPSLFINPFLGSFPGAGSAGLQAQPQPHQQKPAPRVGTAYVIRRELSQDNPNSRYIKVDEPGAFMWVRGLDAATRFLTASAAAHAIVLRNDNHGVSNPYHFVIVPVTVTTTPASLVEKVVETPVPAKTEYEIALVYDRTSVGVVSDVEPSPSGRPGFWRFDNDNPKRFPTAEEAAKMITARRTLPGWFSVEPIIRPVYTPATTVKTVELVGTPATTTVELA